MMGPKIEGYLGAIYCFGRENNAPVATKHLAGAVDVQPSKASSMLDTLESHELIDRETYTGTRLIEDGETVALDPLENDGATALAEYGDDAEVDVTRIQDRDTEEPASPGSIGITPGTERTVVENASIRRVRFDDGTEQWLPDSITDAIRVHPAGTEADERRGVA